MAIKSQSQTPSYIIPNSDKTGTSTPGFFNKMQGVSSASAAAANALNQRTGRGGRRQSPSQIAANKQNLNNKLTFAKDFGTAFGQNLGKAVLDTGKSVLKSPFRVASSIAEIPKVVKSGGSKTSDPYNLPFLGEVKTYARDARDRINAGDGSKMKTVETILGVGGQAMLDTAALGSAAKGAKDFVFGKNGQTSQATNLLRKVAPNKAAKWDQMIYRPYKGSPMGWQLKAAQKFNLPFWKMDPNL